MAALAVDERRKRFAGRKPLPVPEPVAALRANTRSRHRSSMTTRPAGFGQLAEVATELAKQLDEFVRIACPRPVGSVVGMLTAHPQPDRDCQADPSGTSGQ